MRILSLNIGQEMESKIWWNLRFTTVPALFHRLLELPANERLWL